MEAQHSKRPLNPAKPPYQKTVTLNPPLASLPRLPNGAIRVPSPLGTYAKTRARTASLVDHDHDHDHDSDLLPKQRSFSISPQYLVNPDVIRSSLIAAQKSFRDRVQPHEWTPDGQKQDLAAEYIEISNRIHRNPTTVLTETLPDSPTRARTLALRATLEQLFFRLQNTEQLKDDPVFGIDSGADLELGEKNLPLSNISQFAATAIQPLKHDAKLDESLTTHFEQTDDIDSRDNNQLTLQQSEATDSPSNINSSQFVISQDHNGEINDFLLGDACKIGDLLQPLPSVELDRQIVSFSDKQGLSEMEIYGLAFDTCIDYLCSYDKRSKLADIIQTLSRVKSYYVSRLTKSPTQLSAYQEAANILDSKLQVTMRDLKAATLENQELKVQLQNLRNVYTETVKRIDELVYQNTMQSRDMSVLNRRLTISQEQINQLSFTADVLKSELLDEKNKARRLAAMANRFKSNLERMGDRAARAERKANYDELQIIDLEKQKKTMSAEIYRLQEQLNAISGTFNKERIALLSENERLTLENNEFQTTLATGGIFFAGDTEEGNSEVLVRVTDKIYRRTDMGPHAKLAATTILRLCAEDSRVACRRLGITNDGLSAVMWLLTAAKSSDSVATFLKHLHGQYSSYFAAKGTAIQTKDSYMMQVRTQKQKNALAIATKELQEVCFTGPSNPNNAQLGSGASPPTKYDPIGLYNDNPDLLLRKSYKVLLSMHNQLHQYRTNYQQLSADSDEPFKEIQALIVKYYGDTNLEEVPSSLQHETSAYDYCGSAPSISEVDCTAPSRREPHHSGDTQESKDIVDSARSSTINRDTKAHKRTKKSIATHKVSADVSSNAPCKEERLQSEALPKDSILQSDQHPLNVSLDSIDFGGHLVYSRSADETDLCSDGLPGLDGLHVNLADLPDNLLNDINKGISVLASLTSSTEKQTHIRDALQNLVYNNNYNSAIIPIFSKYVQRVVNDKVAIKEALQQNMHDPSKDDLDGLEVLVEKETEQGIIELCRILSTPFDNKKCPEDLALSAYTKDTIHWALDLIKPRIQDPYHQKDKRSAQLSGSNKADIFKKKVTKHHVKKTPHTSACVQRVPHQNLRSEFTDEDTENLSSSARKELDCKRRTSASSSSRQIYYKDVAGEICAVRHSIIPSADADLIDVCEEAFGSTTMPSVPSPCVPSSTQLRLSPSSTVSSQRRTPSPHAEPSAPLSLQALGGSVPISEMPLELSTQLTRSKMLESVVNSAEGKRSPSRSKSNALSQRHQYGLSTRDILARVNALQKEEQIACKLSTSSQDLGQMPVFSEALNNKTIVCDTNGRVWLIDKPKGTSQRDLFKAKLPTVNYDAVYAGALFYVVDNNKDQLLIVSYNPDTLPSQLQAAATRYEVVLSGMHSLKRIFNNKGMNATLFVLDMAVCSSPIEDLRPEDVSVVLAACQLPDTIAKEIREATKMFTSAVQTDPMILDTILTTGDLRVNDMFYVIERLYAAMNISSQQVPLLEANPIQNHFSEMEDGRLGTNDETADAAELAMSRLAAIPIFPDSYVAEQTMQRSTVPIQEDAPNNSEKPENTMVPAETQAPPSASPLLQLLQTYIPRTQPLLSKGLLGPFGVTEYKVVDIPKQAPYPHAHVFAKKTNDLALALSVSPEVKETLRYALKNAVNRVPITDGQRGQIEDQPVAHAKGLQPNSGITGKEFPVVDTLTISKTYNTPRENQNQQNSMALSVTNEDSAFKNADINATFQWSKPSSLSRQADLTISTNSKISRADGSLVVESLNPSIVRDGPLLLRKQHQPLYSVSPGREEQGALYDKRLASKILRHDVESSLQPAISATTFIGSKQSPDTPADPTLTYSKYLQNCKQRDGSPPHPPSYITKTTASTSSQMLIHPRYGYNVLTSQCNPLEPPEGSMLQFIGEPFSAIVTKFGCFRRARCAFPNEIDPSGLRSEEDCILYPCILSSSTDIFTDFSTHISRDANRQNGPRMRQTYEYMLEHIKHLSSAKDTLHGALTRFEGFKVAAKQFSTTKLIIPKPGDSVSYIRKSSLNVKCNETKPILPPIFQLLQELSSRRCELLTIESKIPIDPMHRTYIKIPTTNAYLKSVAWTLKLIKAIYTSRLNMEETYITVREPTEQVMTIAQVSQIDEKQSGTEGPIGATGLGTDVASTRLFNFTVIHGSISRQEAESLPHFLVYYAKSQYGVKNIVTSLLWSLIVSVCHHQYENNDIYLFARFLFGDLDFDFFLTYIDIQKVIGGIQREEVDMAEVPGLVQAILPNWSSKRRYSLCESIYGHKLIKKVGQSYIIPTTHLSQMLLVAYGGFRRSIFQSMTLVWSKLNPDNFLDEGAFREFCEVCVMQLSFNSVTEAFYAFSSVYEDSTPRVPITTTSMSIGPDTVKDLVTRRMHFEKFVDFYLSYCLGRYAIITSLTLDEVMRGTEIKRNIQLVSNVYLRFVPLAKEIASKRLARADEETQVKREGLIKAVRKVFNHLNLVSCDLSAYDYQRAIENMRQGINLLTDCCMDVKGEAASIVLGGGVAALSALMSRDQDPQQQS